MEHEFFSQFGSALIEQLESDDSVVLSDDLPGSWIESFAKLKKVVIVPSSLALNYGCALAEEHRRTWVIGHASSLVDRDFETWRTLTIGVDFPLKVISLAGLTGSDRGLRYQSVDDVTLLRTQSAVKLLIPDDLISAKAMISGSRAMDQPCYLRLSSLLPREIPRLDSKIDLSGSLVAEGIDVTMVGCGVMVLEILKACDLIATYNLTADVIECFNPNNLPQDLLLQSIAKTGLAVVCEEGSTSGGLGEALCRLVCEKQPARVRVIGSHGQGQSGDPASLLEYYGLNGQEIASTVIQALAVRRR